MQGVASGSTSSSFVCFNCRCAHPLYRPFRSGECIHVLQGSHELGEKTTLCGSRGTDDKDVEERTDSDKTEQTRAAHRHNKSSSKSAS
jgi:hypothetical protein